MTRRSLTAGTAGRLGAASLVLCCLAGAARGQFADEIAIFLGDPAAGVAEAHTDTFPTFDTAYLVLLGPTQPDIGGWELRVGTEGPATFLGWQPVGQAVNFATPPQFVVGLGSPLPAAAQVVLAESPLVVTGPGPARFSLLPVFQPSLPGAMSYIPFEHKEPLTPLRPWTGTAVVASYNGDTPVCDLSAEGLNFGDRGLTTVTRRSLTVTNAGGGLLPVDAELAAPFPPYRLVAGGDPVVLAEGQSHVVTVEFQPTTVGEFAQELDLGTGCGPVPMWGLGREPITALEFSIPAVDFGELLVGRSRYRTAYVTNAGEASVLVQPTLPDSCAGFELAYVPPTTLHPGEWVLLNLVFAPRAVGPYACEVALVDGQPGLPLRGVGYLPPDADIEVDPPVVVFGTVVTGSSQTRTVTVTNAGTQSVTLDVAQLGGCAGFTFWPSSGSHALAPGASLVMQIQFHPLEAGAYSCVVGLGDGLPTIPVSGSAATVAGELRLQPAALDFGGVAPGSWSERSLTVINETGATVTVSPSVDPASGFSLTGSPASITLPSNGRHQVNLKFQPEVLGPYSGELALGAGLPTAALSGVGEEPTSGWLVEPASLDFGPFYVGGAFLDRNVDVTNTGNTSQYVSIHLNELFSPFSLLYGGNLWIGPGERHRLLVRFNPDAPGVFTADLVVEGVATVPVTGTGVTDVPDCFVHATSVRFGTVLTGATALRTTYVTNSGSEDFTLLPTTDCDAFLYVGAPVLVEAGRTVPVDIAFNPVTAGEHVCILSLGPSVCDRIVLFGEGSDTLVPDHDLVGVWFDEGLTTGIRNDLVIGEAVPAWVAMLNPSETVGVSGWELRLDLDDGLVLAGWSLQGQAFNIEDAPSFFVGLGSPLPYAPQVLLATFEFLVTDTQMHAVDLVPLWRPSIPGLLAWVYGEDFQLKPMHPISGTPSVAWLSASTPLGVAAPRPAAGLVGGRVELRWTLREGAEGCHVYRALGGRETRLTTAPLQPVGDRFVFLDDPAGLPAGARAAYSYGVLRGGAEIARSPAVEIEVPGAGPTLTRLLPNRPNPFNPETEIHFALARAGRVRVAVFDMSGRRVAVLEDGTRGAGPHHVVWNGRDRAGRVLPSGAYYVQMETDTGRDTRKIMLLK